MSAFIDIEQFTVRAGKNTKSFGNKWTTICQGKVEHNRFVYLYGLSGTCTYREMMDIIRQVRELAKVFNWHGICWERYDNNIVHHVRFHFTKT